MRGHKIAIRCGAVILLVGVAFCLFGAIRGLTYLSIRLSGQKANATVIAYEQSETKRGYYTPIFEFTYQGSTLRVQTDFKSSFKPYDLGEIVTLYYDPQSPKKIALLSVFGSAIAIIPGVMGLLLGWLGFHIYSMGRNVERLHRNGKSVLGEVCSVGWPIPVQIIPHGNFKIYQLKIKWKHYGLAKVSRTYLDLKYGESPPVVGSLVSLRVDTKHPKLAAFDGIAGSKGNEKTHCL